MRDLNAIADHLTSALAHFPAFKVELVQIQRSDKPYIFIFNGDEVVSGVVQWEYQEIEITENNVIMHGGDDRRDGSNLPFEARGNWFAVTAIVFAVLSGRE